MINCDRKSQELHLSTCIQLRMTKHPSRKVMNVRHLLGCDTIVALLVLEIKVAKFPSEEGNESSNSDTYPRKTCLT